MSLRATGVSEYTMQHFSIAGVFIVLMLVVHTWSDEESKLEAAENYMIDYLENVCIRRYEKANLNMQQAQVDEEEPEIPERPERDLSKEREDQERRIRAILEEFLA